MGACANPPLTPLRSAPPLPLLPLAACVYGIVCVCPPQRVLGVHKKPIAAVDPGAVSLAVDIIPHTHSKYCDRRVRRSVPCACILERSPYQSPISCSLVLRAPMRECV